MAFFPSAALATAVECVVAVFSRRRVNVIRLHRPTVASIALALASNIGRVTSRIVRTMHPISVSSSAPNGMATILELLVLTKRFDGCQNMVNHNTTNASYIVA